MSMIFNVVSFPRVPQPKPCMPSLHTCQMPCLYHPPWWVARVSLPTKDSSLLFHHPSPSVIWNTVSVANKQQNNEGSASWSGLKFFVLLGYCHLFFSETPRQASVARLVMVSNLPWLQYCTLVRNVPCILHSLSLSLSLSTCNILKCIFLIVF